MLQPVRIGPNNEVLDYTSDVQDEPSQRSGQKQRLREYLLNNEFGGSSVKDYGGGFVSQRSVFDTQRSAMPQYRFEESEETTVLIPEIAIKAPETSS